MTITKLDIKRLVKCREKLGISKIEAARRIGISQPAYLRYESGERTPSIQVIKEIANVFNTSVDFLTGVSKSDKADSIVVSRENQPELFEIVEQYNKMNSKQCRRILEYARNLNENE